jgi:hypothetical protein
MENVGVLTRLDVGAYSVGVCTAAGIAITTITASSHLERWLGDGLSLLAALSN